MLTGTPAVLDYPRQIPGQQRQHFPRHLDCWCLGHCQLGHCVYSRPKYIREAIVSSLYILRISRSFARYLYAVRIYKPASSTSPNSQAQRLRPSYDAAEAMLIARSEGYPSCSSKSTGRDPLHWCHRSVSSSRSRWAYQGPTRATAVRKEASVSFVEARSATSIF